MTADVVASSLVFDPYPGLQNPPAQGKAMKIGRWHFFIPPMSLFDYKLSLNEGLLKQIDGLSIDPSKMDDPVASAAFDVAFNAAVTLLYRALKRNYPEIDRSVIEQNLDVGNMSEVVGAVVQANNVTDRPPWPMAAPSQPTSA